MATGKVKISQLTELTSASLNTTIVGVDNGITYRMELDTVADAITSAVNTSDRSRISALEAETGSYLTSLPSGLVSESMDLTQLNSFTESIEGRVSNLESTTGSYLTSLDGTISSSQQITDFGFLSESAEIPLGTISGSSQLTSSFDERYLLSSSYLTDSSSFDSRFNGLVTTGSNTFSGSQVFSGSMTVTSGQVIASTITNNSSSLFLQSGSNLYVQNDGLVEITGSLTATSITGSIAATNGVISGSSQLTATFPSKTTGTWTIPTGASMQGFTVDWNHSYQMWVIGNIPNGIISWTANVNVTNSNVPIVGSQYGWYYVEGNALVLTSIPAQIVGENGLISTASFSTTTSNTFEFGITNNSGTTQIINYGYIKLS